MMNTGLHRIVDQPSDLSDQPVFSPRKPGTHPETSAFLRSGDLVYKNKKGESMRIIESLAAVKVADSMRGRIAWDPTAGTWWLWATTHWAAQTTPSAVEKLLADAVHAGTQPIGFKVPYYSGITQIIQRRGLLPLRLVPAGLVPFHNGLLDPMTMTLMPARPDYATDWVLPHAYDPAADCPTIKAWLLDAVGGDVETVRLLRAWLAALMRGIQVQKFMLLLGPGGSGKGTFQRLASALVGVQNTAISSLQALESNRFEFAKLHGKKLVMINETGKHGRSLDGLKAITGGDHLPIEKKHVQQVGSFIFSGLVLLASNEDLLSTDLTSGLERRRLTVRFDAAVSANARAAWNAKGGESTVLHAEIPGLINWVMSLSPNEIRTCFEQNPDRVVNDNLRALMVSNSVADWMLQNCVFEGGARAQVGDKREIHGSEVTFLNADKWLYASYLTHTIRSGLHASVSLQKFTGTVVDMARTLNLRVEKSRDPVTRAATLIGLRLAKKGERPSHLPDLGGLPKGSREDNTLIRINRMDSGSLPQHASTDNIEVF